eukprot:Clim_evm18s166 gene=Clim_evmTU18s166
MMESHAARLEAASVFSYPGKNLGKIISETNVLVVGAGGIGCELLKNLALAGFPSISVIDLDTIELSNLNRQFLFRREHVGQAKAVVAAEAIRQMNPALKVTAYHADILSRDFDVGFFRKHQIVLNALDNIKARNHVNRMCLQSGVPLVESGTRGYSGQVKDIIKGRTPCQECNPPAPQKTFPVCTIRNTPTQPVHCLVWAKFLFGQMFGPEDDDHDVSPDMDDPELQQDNVDGATENAPTQPTTTAETAEQNGNPNGEEESHKRSNFRAWVENVEYDAASVFQRLYKTDVETLLGMTGLWRTRKKPELLPVEDWLQSKDDQLQRVVDTVKPSGQYCAQLFLDSCKQLRERMLQAPRNQLEWDKDDDLGMDFVFAASNLRSLVYHIPVKSRFDCKSIAGNIVPAIATTNAICAGLIMIEALKVLQNQTDALRMTYISENASGKILIPSQHDSPNPHCYICSSTTPQLFLGLRLDLVTVTYLRDTILKNAIHMAHPDEITAGSSILFDADEEITEANLNKTLAELGVQHGDTLEITDSHQNVELRVVVDARAEDLDAEKMYVVQSQQGELKNGGGDMADGTATTGDRTEGTATAGAAAEDDEIVMVVDDDDLIIIEDEEPGLEPDAKRAKHS